MEGEVMWDQLAPLLAVLRWIGQVLLTLAGVIFSAAVAMFAAGWKWSRRIERAITDHKYENAADHDTIWSAMRRTRADLPDKIPRRKRTI